MNSWLPCSRCMLAEKLDNDFYYCPRWQTIEDFGCVYAEPGFPSPPSWDAERAYERYFTGAISQCDHSKAEKTTFLQKICNWLFSRKNEHPMNQEEKKNDDFC